jgi:hypothetical protein
MPVPNLLLQDTLCFSIYFFFSDLCFVGCMIAKNINILIMLNWMPETADVMASLNVCFRNMEDYSRPKLFFAVNVMGFLNVVFSKYGGLQ